MSTYIVALDREVLPEGLVRGRMDTAELVIWRGASGSVHVWEDRCPHRSSRLSAGRNMGAYLEDPYHGWRFAEDGTVIHVPAEGGKAHPEISAHVLASAVTGGFVWASAGVLETGDFAGPPLRPLHFGVSANRVAAELDPTKTRITPWGAAACMVYGIDPDAMAAHRMLTALRRRLEAAG